MKSGSAINLIQTAKMTYIGVLTTLVISNKWGVKVCQKLWLGWDSWRVLPITWFQASLTGQSYLEMLKNKVWPAVKSVASKKNTSFNKMRPEFTQLTDDCLAFFQDKFQRRVISNRLDFLWPAKSPDLNQLDFYFWRVAEARIRKEKPRQ